jgi:hypothetical protein
VCARRSSSGERHQYRVLPRADLPHGFFGELAADIEIAANLANHTAVLQRWLGALEWAASAGD